MTVDWLTPQPIGVDAFGATRYLQTAKTHTAFYGKTRSGKTLAARGFVSFALLDPRVSIACFDGKDDQVDWRPMADLCDIGYVGGSSSASIAGVERLLLRLEQENNARADGSGADRPVVVVVDEWYRIRQAAKRHDPDAAKRIDGLMADLAATSSGRYMHGVFCFQRGTVEFVPGDLGANLGQRVQGWAATPREIQYSIHSNPDVVPSRTGEFLVSSDEGGTSELVVVPHLDYTGFLAVCAAARRLRAPAAPVVLAKASDDPPTWQELVAVILQEAGETMTTSDIHAALGDAAPTPYPNRFGRDLTADAASDLPTVVEARTRRATRGWTLADRLLPTEGEYNPSDSRSQARLLTGAAA